MTVRRSAAPLLCLAVVAVFLAFAAIAAASSGTSFSPDSQQGGTALTDNNNDACLECHGQVPLDGTIEVDGERVPATIDVQGHPKSIYVNPDIQGNSRHGKLACISCHIGFNAGIHPESVTQDWLHTAVSGLPSTYALPW